MSCLTMIKYAINRKMTIYKQNPCGRKYLGLERAKEQSKYLLMFLNYLTGFIASMLNRRPHHCRNS